MIARSKLQKIHDSGHLHNNLDYEEVKIVSKWKGFIQDVWIPDDKTPTKDDSTDLEKEIENLELCFIFSKFAQDWFAIKAFELESLRIYDKIILEKYELGILNI